MQRLPPGTGCPCTTNYQANADRMPHAISAHTQPCTSPQKRKNDPENLKASYALKELSLLHGDLPDAVGEHSSCIQFQQLCPAPFLIQQLTQPCVYFMQHQPASNARQYIVQ